MYTPEIKLKLLATGEFPVIAINTVCSEAMAAVASMCTPQQPGVSISLTHAICGLVVTVPDSIWEKYC